MPPITRNFYITLFIAGCIIFVGGTLAGDSEIGGMVVVIAAFVIGLTLLDVLDSRERRRKQDGGGTTPS